MSVFLRVMRLALLSPIMAIGLCSAANALDVTLSGPSAGCAEFTLTVTFSEAVTGFDEGDLVLTNATAGLSNTADNIVFTVPINTTATGVFIEVPANSAFNAVPEGNNASNVFSYTTNPAWPGGTETGAFDATYTFSEAVTGLAPGDFQLSAGTVGALVGGPDVYTLTVIPPSSSSGTLQIDLPQNAAFDACGNGSTPAPQRCIPFNTEPASPLQVGIQPSNATANLGDTVIFSVANVSGGTEPYLYEWFFLGGSGVGGLTNVSGVFSDTLVISGVNSGGNDNIGAYYCVVTDSTPGTPEMLQSNIVSLTLNGAMPVVALPAMVLVAALISILGAMFGLKQKSDKFR